MATHLEVVERELPPVHAKPEGATTTAWTFCHRCCARTEWAPKCSVCGAINPLFGFGNTRNGTVAPEATQAKEGSGRRRLVSAGFVLGVLIVLGVLAAIFFIPGWLD